MILTIVLKLEKESVGSHEIPYVKVLFLIACELKFFYEDKQLHIFLKVKIIKNRMFSIIDFLKSLIHLTDTYIKAC